DSEAIVPASRKDRIRMPTRYTKQRLALEHERRIQPDAKHRPRRQLDVVPFGFRDRAAAADQDSGERAFRAAEDRAQDRAGARADADLPLLAHDPFALE